MRVAQKTGPCVFPNHLNSLDVGAVNALAELADKLHDRDALPFQVGTIQVEANDFGITGFIQGRQVIAGRLQISHGAFAGMAFEVKSDAVLLASIEHRFEPLHEQFQTDLADIGYGMTGNAAGQGWEEEEMAPAMSRRADEAGHGHFAILQLAQIVR